MLADIVHVISGSWISHRCWTSSSDSTGLFPGTLRSRRGVERPCGLCLRPGQNRGRGVGSRGCRSGCSRGASTSHFYVGLGPEASRSPHTQTLRAWSPPLLHGLRISTRCGRRYTMKEWPSYIRPLGKHMESRQTMSVCRISLETSLGLV